MCCCTFTDIEQGAIDRACCLFVQMEASLIERLSGIDEGADGLWPLALLHSPMEN